MTFRLTNSDHIDMTALRVVLKGRGDFGDSCRGRFLLPGGDYAIRHWPNS